MALTSDDIRTAIAEAGTDARLPEAEMTARVVMSEINGFSRKNQSDRSVNIVARHLLEFADGIRHTVDVS